jgi:hypothetical protein
VLTAAIELSQSDLGDGTQLAWGGGGSNKGRRGYHRLRAERSLQESSDKGRERNCKKGEGAWEEGEGNTSQET